MNLPSLVEYMRDFYVDQFRAFVDDQKKIAPTGVGELKMRLDDGSGKFARLYCFDFLSNDSGNPSPVELRPDVLSFDAITGAYGRARLSIVALRWDDVTCHHDLAEVPEDLSRWFDWWFDAEEKRSDRAADISGCIHSMSFQAGEVGVDFGTAPPDAFWQLVELLEAAGATTIEVRSSAADAE